MFNSKSDIIQIDETVYL